MTATESKTTASWISHVGNLNQPVKKTGGKLSHQTAERKKELLLTQLDNDSYLCLTLISIYADVAEEKSIGFILRQSLKIAEGGHLFVKIFK